MRIFVLFVIGICVTINGQLGSRPEDMCIDKPVRPLSGINIYKLKVSSKFYRRAQPLKVEIIQTIKENRPIIADAFLHVPETDMNSPSAAMEVNSLGYWVPKQVSEYQVTANAISCPFSIWGNDAISAHNDRDLKFNLTGNWYPPTSDYDLRNRQFIKFVAYVTPDPDRTRRRWYKIESKLVRNMNYIAFQRRMKHYNVQMAAMRRHLEQFN